MPGMKNIYGMTAPLGYDNGGQVGDKELMIKAYNLAKANSPDGRISDKDFEFALRQLQGIQDPSAMENYKEIMAKKLTDREGRTPEQEFLDTYGVPMQGNIELDIGDGEKIYGLGDRLTKDVMLDSNNLRNFNLGKPPGTPIVTDADGIPIGYELDSYEGPEDQLPYDPDKGYTENLNELMMDIGGTIKEKVKSAGKSLLEKIKDFAKYGHGDREDYMEIGGEQVDANDSNFRRFIEENYMGEGESYIEGIENYRRKVEGEGFRRGGIVSLNHMTRSL